MLFVIRHRLIALTWKEAKDMKADQIIKNAKIYTSDKDMPLAAALAVKDGRFVYVGDEAGLSEYEGEVRDLGGRFIMPGLIDSHVHVTMGAGFEHTDLGSFVECDSKQGALDFMADYIRPEALRVPSGTEIPA